MITELYIPNKEDKPSVQDSLWCVAYSDNSGAIDMKYVYDVYVNNQQIVRAKIHPEPTSKRGYFDASAVVRNEMVLDWFNPNGYVFNAEPNYEGQIAISFDVRVGEDVSGLTTTNEMSGQTTAFNWIPNVFKRRQKGILDKDGKWITNRNLMANVGLDDLNLFVPFQYDSTCVMHVYTYGFDNQEIASATIGTYGADRTYYQFDISPRAINKDYDATLIDGNVKYYKVVINEEEYIVNVVCDHRYTPILLHFINNYGMFETARFGLVSKLSLQTERKTYTKNEFTYGPDRVNYFDSNNVYNESKINYGSKTNWEYKLTMNYPSDTEYEWLNELILSPQVYAEIDGDYYPISIKETNYEYSKHIFNRLKVFEITIELNQTRYGFRR